MAPWGEKHSLCAAPSERQELVSSSKFHLMRVCVCLPRGPQLPWPVRYAPPLGPATPDEIFFFQNFVSWVSFFISLRGATAPLAASLGPRKSLQKMCRYIFAELYLLEFGDKIIAKKYSEKKRIITNGHCQELNMRHTAVRLSC